MAQTALLLIVGFLVLCCGILYRSRQYWFEKWEAERDCHHRVGDSLARLLKSEAAPLTAQQIANRKPFRIHKSWAEERAELEAKHATKDQEHDRRVQEFENQGA